MEEETAVKVCLRVRPLIDIEVNKNCGKVIQYPAPNEIAMSAEKAFTFDYVYNDTIQQKEIYEGAVSPVVKNFLHGYNTTILAYGQTGSGKTFTMGTAGKQEGVANKDLGIIPRVVTELFTTINEQQQKAEYEVRVCFLEIHNEQIKDLLNPSSNDNVRTLAIREGLGGEISVSGAEEVVVTSAESMFRLLEQGSHNRATGSTNMNSTSSRSHAVFTITLAQTKKRKSSKTTTAAIFPSSAPLSPLSTSSNTSVLSPSEGEDEQPGVDTAEEEQPDDEEVEVLTSKFHFVDLAGSERLKRTGATGDRMKEGISINSGLLALANCISALASEKKGQHVPFRDSKITRLLQDSLGGNSQTLMIACISPADVNYEESLNTLRYANRARNIKNKPVINRNPHTQKILRLTARVAELEALLALQGAAVPSSGLKSALNSTVVSHLEYKLLQDQVLLYSTETQRLDAKLTETRVALAESNDALLSSQVKIDELNLLLSKLSPASSMKLDGKDNALLADLKQCRQGLSEQTQALAKARAELTHKQYLIEILEEQYGKADADMLVRVEQKVKEKLSTGSSKTTLTEVEDESEAKRIHELTQLKNREYEMKMEQLNRVVVHLDSGIKQKEHLLNELKREKDETDAVERTLSTKIEQAESDLRAVTKQKEDTVKTAQASDAQVLVVKYSRKIDELNAQLKQFREKLKEANALKGKLEADEKRIATLQEEIAASKKQKVQLTHQIKEKTETYQQWMKEKDLKLHSMTKEARKQQHSLGKLQSEFEKQSHLLKRVNEQKAELRQKLEAEKEKNLKTVATMTSLLHQKRAGVAAPTTTSGIKRTIAVQALQNNTKKSLSTATTATSVASTTSTTSPTSPTPTTSTTPATATTTSATTTSTTTTSSTTSTSKPIHGTKKPITNPVKTHGQSFGMKPKFPLTKQTGLVASKKPKDVGQENVVENAGVTKSERRKSGRLALADLTPNILSNRESVIDAVVDKSERRQSGRLALLDAISASSPTQSPTKVLLSSKKRTHADTTPLANDFESARRKSGRLSTPDLSDLLKTPPSMALSPSSLLSSLRKRRHSLDLRTPRPRLPRKQDASTVDISQSMQELEQDLVNRLNTAPMKELTKMPMIGRKRMQLIVSHRETTPFKTVSDLSCIGFSEKNIMHFLQRNMIGKIWNETDVNLLNHVA